MKQTIWLICDSDEPPEGPLWSARVRILVEEAQKLGIPVITFNITDIDRTPIEEYDLLLYRPTFRGVFRDTFRKKILASNKGFLPNRSFPHIGTKKGFWQIAKQLQLPIPKTWSRDEFIQYPIQSTVGFVVKISRSSQGAGVFRCKSYQDVLETLNRIEEEVIIQEFIALPTIQDHRVLMIGNDMVGAFRRVLNDGIQDEFRANLSLGSAHAQEDHPSPTLLNDVHTLMRYTDLDFVGIDYLQIQGTHLFLECNTHPGLLGVTQFLPQTPHRVLLALLKRARTKAQS